MLIGVESFGFRGLPPPFTSFPPPSWLGFLGICWLVVIFGGVGFGFGSLFGGGLVSPLSPPWLAGFSVTGFVWSRGSQGSVGLMLVCNGVLGIGGLHGFGFLVVWFTIVSVGLVSLFWAVGLGALSILIFGSKFFSLYFPLSLNFRMASLTRDFFFLSPPHSGLN